VRLSGLVSVLSVSACGQKGPPLAPIVLLPSPVTAVTVKRVENDVVLQFTVPTANTDGSGPADLRRVEVYAHTGPLPAPVDFVKYGTLVASVDIKAPPEPSEPGAEGATDAAGATGAKPESPTDTRSVKVEPQMIEQGWTTSVRETLKPEHREIGPMPPTRPIAATETPVVVERLETPGTVNFELPPQRYYTIVPVSESRNRRGTFAGPIQVALIEPLTPPEKVDLTYTADAVSLTWPGQPEDIAPIAPVAPVAPIAPIAPSAPPLPELERFLDAIHTYRRQKAV
jgi:hypothetical protein